MQIRESTADDRAAIWQLHRAAFGDAEGEVVAQLAVDLLADRTAQPLLSLVAETEERLTANVIFSALAVAGTDLAGAYILCPLAVHSDSQGCGTGTALVDRGLAILRSRSAAFVMVLGDPAYYSRLGFHAHHGIRPPYELAQPDAWMAQELRQGALDSIRGTAQCAATLSSPVHW